MQCGLWANGIPTSQVLVVISSTSTCQLYQKCAFILENSIEKSSWPLNKLNFATLLFLFPKSLTSQYSILFFKPSSAPVTPANQRPNQRLPWLTLPPKRQTGIAHGSTNFNGGLVAWSLWMTWEEHPTLKSKWSFAHSPTISYKIENTNFIGCSFQCH